MKLLHAADLHLGRTFHEWSLADDQRLVLDQILDLLEGGDYAALVLAGDVYDRSAPSPEAMRLLGTFLAEARRRAPSTTVLAIPGNHDSAERLSYGGELFAALGIHLRADLRRAAEPVWVEKDGERAALFGLPFLSPGAPGSEGARSQAELASRASALLGEARAAALASGADHCVLAAHLFALGGGGTESERVFLGTAERVDVGLFSDFDYVALGHLHRRQKAGARAWYSGSPLPYSFDEAGDPKGVLSVELVPGEEPKVEPLPLKPLRRVVRLSGPFESFMETGSYAEHQGDYLELSLDDRALVENPQALLRTRFPYLLSIRQDRALSTLGGELRADFEERRAARASGADARRGAADDFADFLEDLYGSADAAEVADFAALAEEAQHAAP